MPFSKDFLWGGATAANQCEGGYNQGGRGLPMSTLFHTERIVFQLLQGK